jgi:hypothetical protein
MTIDEEMKALIEDAAVVIGTRDSDFVPEMTYAWGPRVLDGGRQVDLFVDRDAAKQTLANLRTNRQIAASCGNPINYQAVQLKGWCVEIADPTPQDEAWVERHREAFSEAIRARGVPSHVTRTLWSRYIVRIRLSVDEVYDQTPGPGAGRKL